MSDTSPESVSIAIFDSEYHYPEWFNAKILHFYKKKLKHLEKLRFIHSESAAYYSKLHLKLYAPSIVITGLSGVASFLSSSSLFNNDTQTVLAIGVGVLASVSAMIQSAGSAVDYNTKAKIHGEAGEEYEKLMTKLEFEMEMPNEPDFLDNLENLILEIQNKCKYAPPQHIVDKYNGNKHKKKNRKQVKDIIKPLENVVVNTLGNEIISKVENISTNVENQIVTTQIENVTDMINSIEIDTKPDEVETTPLNTDITKNTDYKTLIINEPQHSSV